MDATVSVNPDWPFNPKPDPAPPVLPNKWECTALLQSYSPPPPIDSKTIPFYQLCLAHIAFSDGDVMSICVVGQEYGTWWYKITPDETRVSRDLGVSWSVVDMGWTLPTTLWLDSHASYFNTGYLNWMEAQEVDWWKQPVSGSNATTWIWFDSTTELPFRMMFGAPPPAPDKGDPDQLAFFQNFSFTYFPTFEATDTPKTDTWVAPSIDGFQAGNPDGYDLIEWNPHFWMNTVMTPVDSMSLPLPTVVLYQWKPDTDYQVATDRAQATLMSYSYQPTYKCLMQEALLYGVAPSGTTPPPHAGDGYLFDWGLNFPARFGVTSCQNMGLGQEPPDWASIPSVNGTIHGTIKNNAALSPNQTTNLITVLFPPSKEYPQGRYLWTWYSLLPQSNNGKHCRPVTFMESASTISEGGTSLALADYYNYNEQTTWFSGEYFTLPELCKDKKSGVS